MKKIIVLLLSTLFFSKVFPEIISVTKLTNETGSRILILGERHHLLPIYKETQHKEHASVLHSFFPLISKSKSIYLYESKKRIYPKEYLEMIAKSPISEIISNSLGLLDCIAYFDIKFKSKIGNLIFEQADIRIESKIYDLARNFADKSFVFNPLTLDAYCNCYVDHLSRTNKIILPQIEERILKLNEDETIRKLLKSKYETIKEEIQNFQKNLKEIFSKTEDEVIDESDSKKFIKFFLRITRYLHIADIGFILSIFEALEKKYQTIIVDTGNAHAQNLIESLCKDFNFKKEIYFDGSKNNTPIEASQFTKILNEIFNTEINENINTTNHSPSSESKKSDSTSCSSSSISSASSSSVIANTAAAILSSSSSINSSSIARSTVVDDNNSTRQSNSRKSSSSIGTGIPKFTQCFEDDNL